MIGLLLALNPQHQHLHVEFLSLHIYIHDGHGDIKVLIYTVLV